MTTQVSKKDPTISDRKPVELPNKQIKYRVHLILLILTLLCAVIYLEMKNSSNFMPSPYTLTLPTQPPIQQIPLDLAPPSHPAPGSRVTFTPNPLNPSVELGNPQRGAEYYGGEAPPPGWPLADRYQRWCWRDLEPQEGQYNFSLIDQQLSEAAAAGYTFGFRIMPSNPGQACMPDYLSSTSYNDPQYLARAQALFTALGQRYNHDPRLGWLDMSLYGCWGEWNESCGGNTMSAGNRQTLINMQYQAFPNKRFLMFTAHLDSLDYALSLRRIQPTGVRIDCLGQNSIGGGRDALASDSTARNQWHVAPLYFEYCGGPNFQQALADIKTYHASIIGDGAGNLHSFGSYSSQDQSLLEQNYQASGYRFVLDNVSIPSQLVAGGNFSVVTHWSNINVAPAYHAWTALFQLRDAAGQVAWQGASTTNLQTLLPTRDATGRDHPITTTDHFSLPNTVHSANYTLSLQVVDPTRYYHPLRLAIQGSQPDGSYSLGTIIVP